MFEIKSMTLHRLQMNLRRPFKTSFGTVEKKDFFLIEVMDQEGNKGYGESVAFTIPWYTEETTETVLHMMQQFLIPPLRGHAFVHPDELSELFSAVKRNNMAKAAIEGAVWDLYAKRKRQTLSEAIGGTRKTIDVGISLGMEENIEHLLTNIDHYVQEGYKRVKIKIDRKRDIQVLQEIRKHFPDVPLLVDANSAYTLQDIDHLKQFDQFNLMMIEQPLADDDIYEHALLQKEVSTPICLDESIHSLTDVKLAIELGSCKIINIKSGRVGGLTNARKIHDYCADYGVDVWVGGMLDAGIGRAHNIALATLSNFTLPGDIGASSHYWQKDIIKPEVKVKQGIIQVSERNGIGYDIDWEAVKHYTIDTQSFIL